MSLINVLAESVRPERLATFEENVRKVAEAAVAAREPLHWATHQTVLGEIGWFFFVAPARDFAEIQQRGTAEEMVRRGHRVEVWTVKKLAKEARRGGRS